MYPATRAERDRFILERRGPRPPFDPWSCQGMSVEDERTAAGSAARTATVFLTGRECPWRCAMCDLWQHTTVTDTPPGAIPAQIAAARSTLAQQPDRVTQMKLYNAGSFFDPRAVPEGDYHDIAAAVDGLDRVIVESHPALIGARVDRFLDALDRRPSRSGTPPRLEVAMGLETAHRAALQQLHKQLTVEEFSAAAQRLKCCGVALRVFLLISPPFVAADEQDVWLLHSIDVAFSCGATAVTLIPTRSGNGAMEALAAEGAFRAPGLDDIERSIAAGLSRRPDGRLFVDLWNLEEFSRCPHCFEARRARLQTMNLEQRTVPPPSCACGGRRGTS